MCRVRLARLLQICLCRNSNRRKTTWAASTLLFLQRGPAIESTLPDVSAESTLGTATEVPPPRPQIQVPPQESLAATLGSCQESPLVPSASEHDASTPEMATERMLAEAMPHYDSGMQALNRFLRLVTDGGQKKR